MQVSTHPITRRFTVNSNVPNRSYNNLHQVNVIFIFFTIVNMPQVNRRVCQERPENDRMDPNTTKNPPFTAARFCVRIIRVIGALYLMACDETSKAWKCTGYIEPCG